MEYDPDEEEVENQLIEIDNRLIHLDGSIENINDGVRHLGEALATAQNDETVEALLDDIDDDRFLFDDGADSELAMTGIRTDPGFHLFDDWRMDSEPDLDEILTGVSDAAVASGATVDNLKVRLTFSKTAFHFFPSFLFKHFCACKFVRFKGRYFFSL